MVLIKNGTGINKEWLEYLQDKKNNKIRKKDKDAIK